MLDGIAVAAIIDSGSQMSIGNQPRIFKEPGYGDKPAILLGIDALRLFDRVSIDFVQKKVRFVLPTEAMARRYQTAARW